MPNNYIDQVQSPTGQIFDIHAKNESSFQQTLVGGENIKKIEVGGTEYDLMTDPETPLVITGGGGGTSNYNNLSNKPQISGNELSGNKTFANLGLTVSHTDSTMTGLTVDGSSYNVVDEKVLIQDVNSIPPQEYVYPTLASSVSGSSAQSTYMVSTLYTDDQEVYYYDSPGLANDDKELAVLGDITTALSAKLKNIHKVYLVTNTSQVTNPQQGDVAIVY